MELGVLEEFRGDALAREGHRDDLQASFAPMLHGWDAVCIVRDEDDAIGRPYQVAETLTHFCRPA